MQVILEAFDPVAIAVYDRSHSGVLPEKQFHFPDMKTLRVKVRCHPFLRFISSTENVSVVASCHVIIASTLVQRSGD